MIQLLFGHLVGDYLLQTESMAINKSKNTSEGWLACTNHCMIYTASVCLLMWNFDPLWIGAVFVSHFPIDKFALAGHWMHYVKGKSMKDYVLKDDRPYINNPPLTRYDILEGGFTSIVYTVTDNTMHILLMWGAYNLIY